MIRVWVSKKQKGWGNPYPALDVMRTIYLYSEDKCTFAVMQDGSEQIVEQSLVQCLKEIDFVMVRRGVAVNPAKVERLLVGTGVGLARFVVTVTGQRLKIARRNSECLAKEAISRGWPCVPTRHCAKL